VGVLRPGFVDLEPAMAQATEQVIMLTTASPSASTETARMRKTKPNFPSACPGGWKYRGTVCR